MLDQPSREAKLVRDSLGKDTLPSFALNNEITTCGRKPSACPIIRTDYDKHSDDTLIKCQNHRSLRLLIIRDIFLLGSEHLVNLPPWMRRRTLKELWEVLHQSDRQEMELPKRLALAEAVKDKANERVTLTRSEGK
ncbi:hypothetical protein V866_000040 [Kwoniella sp. B9012]|uniref:Uncharacterized protein n=1 Tax=Kwoniella europaea PYCC6329 TaxID=1423913 RepID=A0AAX4K8U8_9TREE